MIYLFDDTPDQYIKLFIDFVDYEGVIQRYPRMTMEQLYSITCDIQQADCICIHRSYRDADDEDSGSVKDWIVNEISNNGRNIPLVIFSGEDKGKPEFKRETYIRAINKDRFYGNLGVFLDNYRQSGSIDLNFLAFGRNTGVNIATSNAQAILTRIRFKSPDEPLLSDSVAGTNLMNLVAAAQPEIGCSYGDIIAEINSGNLTVGEFRDRISRIISSFSQYGKNIHPWR